MNKEIVGVIQGSIKIVTLHKPPKNVAKVGYILGLRVSPVHRRKGIGLQLVVHVEEWFNANQVDYSYMATEKTNDASVHLFVNKLGYVKFRTPTILVQPVVHKSRRLSSFSNSGIEIVKLKIEQAELLYRNYMMSSTEFFPHDIDKILRNKLSLGTWVAAYRGNRGFGNYGNGVNNTIPNSWAMVSVWNSGGVFKMRLGKAPLSCLIYSKSSRIMDKAFPCFRSSSSSSSSSWCDDFLEPFGFYFMYGVYRSEGPSSGKLLRALCKFVHNNLATESRDCKAVVTEIGGGSDHSLKHYIPHWKLLSCPEDLWCIKPLKRQLLLLLSNKTPSLFVDPREV